MTDFGRRAGGDMMKSVYDEDDDGIISIMHTRADMETATYDPTKTGIVADSRKLELSTKAQVQDHTPKYHVHSPPAAHKATHQDGGADQIVCAGLVGRVNYVNRGDPTGHDFDVGDFITDETLRDLSLAAIVPAGALVAHIRSWLNCGSVDGAVALIKGGNGNLINSLYMKTPVANRNHTYEGLVALNANRVIQYHISNHTWSAIYITVRGWLI